MNKSSESSRSFVVIAAAGSGIRMGAGPNKVLRTIAGVTVLQRSVAPFLALVDGCVISVPEIHLSEYRALFDGLPNVHIIPGGASRYHSVLHGLEHIREHFDPNPQDIVLVHDGARCFVSADLITRVISSARITGATIPATPVIDTIKSVSSSDTVIASLDRGALRAVQTPQGFHFSVLYSAYREAGNRVVTDDAGLVESFHPVTVVPGEDSNIKITRPFDLVFAESLVAQQGLALTGCVHD